jgi:tetratricopeptide (TPR) repeat protein
MIQPSLASITALARAGATDQAVRLYYASGFDDSIRDASAQTVRARLLKDLASRRSGDERHGLYHEAALAYQRAAELRPATYPLINAASLYLLAGERHEAARLGKDVLSRIQGDPDEPETPYWRSATLAEALLILDRDEEARAAFAEAVALAPRAWEDHASTLRQFGLILEAQGKDSSWLDAHRPPRSLHFGGHMSFDAGVAKRAHLEERIGAILEEEKVGFGFGALAAGADIIIAEALVERGAELHAVLPGGADAFAAMSVDPFGKSWRKRFDRLLEQAETVRPVRPLGTRPDGGMIALADEIAMGAALMHARRLESSGVQLLVLGAGEAENGASGRSRAVWAAGGWRQRIVEAPRETAAGPSPVPVADEAAAPLAVLAAGLAPDASLPMEEALSRLREAIESLPESALPPYVSEERLILPFQGVGEAAEAAVRLLARLAGTPLRIGGSYGPAATFRDPFCGGLRLASAATAAATGALASAPAGTAFVTDDFASALAAAGPRRPASEYVGELDPPDGGAPVGLYALKSYDQLFQPMGGEQS